MAKKIKTKKVKKIDTSNFTRNTYENKVNKKYAVIVKNKLAETVAVIYDPRVKNSMKHYFNPDKISIEQMNNLANSTNKLFANKGIGYTVSADKDFTKVDKNLLKVHRAKAIADKKAVKFKKIESRLG